MDKNYFYGILIVIILVSGCTDRPDISEDKWPLVSGHDPSYKVGTFYYPWYRNQEVDSIWRHWEEDKGIKFNPPLDISSDYYPVLGAYSSTEPNVAAQHFAWIREAQIGVILVSWWGRESLEDKTVPLLLKVAEHYKIKVAFNIEPYEGRTPETVVEDIKYIYSKYGDHPAFFRTTDSSRWSPDNKSKGLFFVWAIPDLTDADAWQKGLDKIHNLPEGGIVIGHSTDADWVDAGHFDGLYNYNAVNDKELAELEGWAQNIPKGGWYVPGVIPGYSDARISPEKPLYEPRQSGATYKKQWEAVLSYGVEPKMVTVTSFNEWHEGTQIEPAAENMNSGYGYTYKNYRPLSPEGYLELTREWVNRFINMNWNSSISS